MFKNKILFIYIMISLYKLDLKLEKEYINILDQLLKILFSYIFIIIVEGNKSIDTFTLLTYNLLGLLFYNLVFKKIIIFE